MRKTIVVCLVALFAVTSLAVVANARDAVEQRLRFTEAPAASAPLPADLVGRVGALRSAAQADTFLLLYETFDDDTDFPPGWTIHDQTAQLDLYWHAASGNMVGDNELDGGTDGNLLPLAGNWSFWCGQAPSTVDPYCNFATLPGYGNGWEQIAAGSVENADSLHLSYKVFWDSEPGYDETIVQYSFDGGTNWMNFSVNAGLGIYDGTGTAPYIMETLSTGPRAGGNGDIYYRFWFHSDGAWSDQDGLWPTDGAIIIDDVTVTAWAGGTGTPTTDTFEGGAPTILTVTAMSPPGFGGVYEGGTLAWPNAGGDTFAWLYLGASEVSQEDDCFQNLTLMIGFFDDPFYTRYDCHEPEPWSHQGAMPFGRIVEGEGFYLWNEVWSPRVENTGAGAEYRFSFLVNRDLPLDNLQFYLWAVRSWKNNCPLSWREFSFVYFGGQKDWLTQVHSIGVLIANSPTDADSVQVMVSALDACGFWCGIYGTGACHSHAPLFDQIKLQRINTLGPQFSVRHIDLFQDNFASDGSLTGTARIDMANDISRQSDASQLDPGDSTLVNIGGVGAAAGGGPSAYLFARVQNSNHAAYTGSQMESLDQRNAAARFPYTASEDMSGFFAFQMDSTFTSGGGLVQGRYCADLHDSLLVPGDTLLYFLGATDGTTWTYVHRTLDGQGAITVTGVAAEAMASPMEMMVLPAGGYNRGGDILYVDDSDDRGGPLQLYFDSAFDMLNIRDKVDRYDVLGPSSAVANGLESRVTSYTNQIVNVYKKIIWASGNLSAGTIGDGSGSPEKSDDYALLQFFLENTTMKGGIYASGDNLSEEMDWLIGGWTGSPSAIAFKASIDHTLVSGDHINYGLPVSPTLVASGPAFGGETFIAYGGCALLNDFDVLAPAGDAIEQVPYPGSTAQDLRSAVISQTTVYADTVKVVWSGFSYHYIRDAVSTFPPYRVTHLRDILLLLDNIVDEASGTEGDSPIFANALFVAYPNPFNPTTTIKYTIKERAHVSLKVYNVAGQLVTTLVDEVQSPDAIKPVQWHGTNDNGETVASGVYFYKVVTKGFAQTRKMVLLK